MKIGMFVCICEKDMEWADQFAKEAKRLNFPVAWTADRLSKESLEKLRSYDITLGVHESKEEFSERTKRFGLETLQKNGFDWGIQMDVDETFELDAEAKIRKECEEHADFHIGRCTMVTAWWDGEWKLRTDRQFGGNGIETSRERVYNLKYGWVWIDPITCGAKLCLDGLFPETYKPFMMDVVSVHWGYSSDRLRAEHKEKWDGVYTKVWGKQPYGTYELLTDATIEVTTIPMPEQYYGHVL